MSEYMFLFLCNGAVIYRGCYCIQITILQQKIIVMRSSHTYAAPPLKHIVGGTAGAANSHGQRVRGAMHWWTGGSTEQTGARQHRRAVD